MTEDEADILYCEKHENDKRHPLRDVLRDSGDDDIVRPLSCLKSQRRISDNLMARSVAESRYAS